MTNIKCISIGMNVHKCVWGIYLRKGLMCVFAVTWRVWIEANKWISFVVDWRVFVLLATSQVSFAVNSGFGLALSVGFECATLRFRLVRKNEEFSAKTRLDSS